MDLRRCNKLPTSTVDGMLRLEKILLLLYSQYYFVTDVGQQDVEDFYSGRPPAPPEDEVPLVNGSQTSSGMRFSDKMQPN